MCFKNQRARFVYYLRNSCFSLTSAVTNRSCPPLVCYETFCQVQIIYNGSSCLFPLELTNGSAMLQPVIIGPTTERSCCGSPEACRPPGEGCWIDRKSCLKPKSGAHDTEAYKVPEYFLYGRHSFAEAEIELGPYRCPQPNANRK